MTLALTTPTELKRNWQAFAALDSVLMPDFAFRYYSFDACWDATEKHEVGSARDGEGQEAFARFSSNGVVGKVVTRQSGGSDMRARLAQKLPAEHRSFIDEPAFSCDFASFFFWIRQGDEAWSFLPESANDLGILRDLQLGVTKYISWATGYYERAIDTTIALKFLNELPNAFQTATELNAKVTRDEFHAEVSEIFGTGKLES